MVQSENILLRFLCPGHAGDGCSCNHRSIPPVKDNPSQDLTGVFCVNLVEKWTQYNRNWLLIGKRTFRVSCSVSCSMSISNNNDRRDCDWKIIQADVNYLPFAISAISLDYSTRNRTQQLYNSLWIIWVYTCPLILINIDPCLCVLWNKYWLWWQIWSSKVAIKGTGVL